MNRVVTSRVATLMTAAIVVVIAACSDANGSQPGLTGPNASTSQGGSAGDTAKNTPGNPGGGHPDSSGTCPGPKPVASFTLPRASAAASGATDAVTTDPVAGATVSVSRRRSPSSGTPARTPSTSTRRWLAAAYQTRTATSSEPQGHRLH
jgi:hypothetical protein